MAAFGRSRTIGSRILENSYETTRNEAFRNEPTCTAAHRGVASSPAGVWRCLNRPRLVGFSGPRSIGPHGEVTARSRLSHTP